MSVHPVSETTSASASAGAQMHALAAALYPLCRSITGDGIRETLRLVQEHLPLEWHEVASGTPVFDWTVPKEWNIRDAWIKNSQGERVVDFQKHNLHVVNYSAPVRKTMTLAELKPFLFSLPDQPDLIPYRTTYYKETWGFCLPHRQLLTLPEDNYEVCIDATLAPGRLTYGEYYLPGKTTDEVLISCHCCHPSLANDNLSGIVLGVQLAKLIAQQPRRYSYRFLFIPATIGAVTWLALNKDVTKSIQHGLVLTCVGDPGKLNYKKSRRGDAEIDRAVLHILKHSGQPYGVIDFFPYGYDERQYCSPGFNLPVGCFMRSQHGQFPEYHTSADNLDFITPEALGDSFAKAAAVLDLLEANKTFLNLNPHCEPQLGKRGLYGVPGTDVLAMLWVLSLSDGQHSLLDIADRADLPFGLVERSAGALLSCGLLREAVPAL